MSTLKSSNENLTLNADGSGNDIKFQSNGVEKASLTDGGVFTATSFTGSGANLTSLPADSTKLSLSGGAMTGAITTNSTFDGVDIATRDAVLTSTTTTANAALPKAGGTMTGDLNLGNNIDINLGANVDGKIYSNGTVLRIEGQNSNSTLHLLSDDKVVIGSKSLSETFAVFNDDGAVELYHNDAKKIETTANGVTVTGGAVGTMTTDNDGSFSMSASNNFKCTPTGNFTLTFTNIVAQSGNILLVNSGGHTVSAHANTKVDANLLATVSTAGTYLLSYFSDGTNVYMTNSAIYT